MGLFDKKFCDLCGNKIGLLGNNKLADGNMCSDCAKKLSNWFTNRRESTVAQIKEQLADREQNAALLSRFSPTIKLGNDEFFQVDEVMGRFLVLREGERMDRNPDLLELSRVQSARLEIREDTTEVYQKDANGSRKAYQPPHYSYRYRFYIIIAYDGPWFRELRFQVHTSSVDGGTDGERYRGLIPTQSLGNQLLGQLGVTPAVPTQIVRTGSPTHRDDLPGGYRPDGYTTMKPYNIRQYEELAALGAQIVTLLNEKKQAAPAIENGSWTCACGNVNTGKFCEECGSPRP